MPIANIFGFLDKIGGYNGNRFDEIQNWEPPTESDKSFFDTLTDNWEKWNDKQSQSDSSGSQTGSSSTLPNSASIITNFLKNIFKVFGSDTVKDSVIENLVPGSTSSDSSNVDKIMDELKTYFDGLMTNQGKENELNRQYNSAEAALNREFQSSEAQLQRDWYEAMSNTAYQRATADMKAAGLNPMLAYSQGGAASSGTGVSAGSAASYSATGGDTLSSLLSAASDVIDSVAYSSASKVNKAFKIIKMLGG